VYLTETFDWSPFEGRKNAKLNQLNLIYQQTIELSPLADDPLSKMISLAFTVAGNDAKPEDTFTDLEPILHCKDSLKLAFTSAIIEPYRNLFRLRHFLRRKLLILKKFVLTFKSFYFFQSILRQSTLNVACGA
jgi:hypothetical protein